jgi:hypothetical protein
MELFKDVLEFLWDRESQMSRILQDAHALIGQGEKDHGGMKDSSISNHVDVTFQEYTDFR